MEMSRQLISSGSKWEPIVGYSRAVRAGPYVCVAGTTAVDASGKLAGRGDPYAQTRQVLRNILAALDQDGADPTLMVRTRMYAANISHWPDIGRAHQEVFGDVRPAATLVEVSGLVDPEMLVEIEVDVIVSPASAD